METLYGNFIFNNEILSKDPRVSDFMPFIVTNSCSLLLACCRRGLPCFTNTCFYNSAFLEDHTVNVDIFA